MLARGLPPALRFYVVLEGEKFLYCVLCDFVLATTRTVALLSEDRASELLN